MANRMNALLAKSSPMERMALFNGGVYLSITGKCNCRCRHCIAEGEEPINDDADQDSVLNWIEQLAENSVKVVHFVGGEPFVIRKKLNRFVEKVGEVGMFASVVTNGYWATSVQKGIEVLNEMPALNILILSSDKYHLEYVNAETIKNAIEAGLATEKLVVINATYVNKEEVKEINDIYKSYKNKVFIQSVRALPFGGAEFLNVDRDPLFQTVNKIPAFCNVGNYFIDINGEVSSCCQASRSLTKYLCVGQLSEEKFGTMVERLPQNKLYQFIKKKGPKGIAEVFLNSPYAEQLRDKQYTGYCEFCLELFSNEETLSYFMNQIS